MILTHGDRKMLFDSNCTLTPCERTILYDSLCVLRDEFSRNGEDVSDMLNHLETQQEDLFYLTDKDKKILIDALRSVPEEFDIPELYQNALYYLEEKLIKTND